MPSKESQAIAEKYIPDFGDGNWGQAMRAGKVAGLARDIDELRIADLEAAAKKICGRCANGVELKTDSVGYIHWTGVGDRSCVESCPAGVLHRTIAALRAAQRKDGAE